VPCLAPLGHLTGGYVAPLRYAKISQDETSHIPGTLSEMPAVALMEDDKDVEFG